MFYCVFAYNNIAAGYECLAAYSLKADAEKFAAGVTGKKAIVSERSWNDMADHMFSYRLGTLRAPIEALAEFAKAGRLKVADDDGLAFLHGGHELPADVSKRKPE